MVVTIDEHSHLEVVGRLVLIKRGHYTTVLKCTDHNAALRMLHALYSVNKNFDQEAQLSAHARLS